MSDKTSEIGGAILAIALIIIGVNGFRACSDQGVTPLIDDHWGYTTQLTSLHLDQSQTLHGTTHGETTGSILGSVGYVNGQIDGKPGLYMYIRYQDEHGNIIDKLIPRDKVSLREDATEQQGSIEFKGSWERTATKQEFRENKHKNQETFFPAREKNADDNPTPRPCFTQVENCWDGASKNDTDVNIIVHIPKGAIIPDIDPNTIHKQ